MSIENAFSKSPSYWIYTFETSRHWFPPISSVHLYIIRWNISLIKEGVTFGCFHVTALVCWQYQIRVYIILLRSGSHFDKRKVSKINKYWKFKSVMVSSQESISCVYNGKYSAAMFLCFDIRFRILNLIF